MKTAKSKVDKIRLMLSELYPGLSIDELHEAALDLHDIEMSSRTIASQIRSLHSEKLTNADKRDKLYTIEAELFSHLIPNHALSLEKFFCKTLNG